MSTVLLYPGSSGWTYDFNARALAASLSSRFDIRIAHTADQAHHLAQHADVIVDFWWRGSMEHHYGRRVIKQISSHRWQRHKYGSLLPLTLVARHVAKAGAVIVPSVRLERIIANAIGQTSLDVPVYLTPKGFSPELFSFAERMHAELRVGWAGSARGADKRVKLLRAACPDLHEQGPYSTGGERPYEQMGAFYQSIDVITCASDAEGDPRTLIEGMACGCFPVTTNVGIVPELVRDGIDGLIVEQSEEAFRKAFAWCRDNLDYVREAGRRNAERMLATRTWAQCAPRWAYAFDAVIARNKEQAA